MTLNKDAITPEFLLKSDGKLAWTCDSYLMMNGIQGVECPTFDFLNHVWDVKQQCRDNGMVFKH